MGLLTDEFYRLMAAKLDISEHLGMLRGLACDSGVKTIAEIGFRTGVSAVALLTAGKPVFSYDIANCAAHAERVRKMAPKFTFTQADSLQITLPEVELLHIDSLHTYKQLKAELCRHHTRVTKWIALHDTTTFGTMSQDKTKPGLLQAIDEFLATEGKDWRVQLTLTHNNGFTLLQREPSTPQ